MTFAEFVTALEDGAPSSVKRVFHGTPASLNASDLPAWWVQLPSGSDAQLTFGASGGWMTYRLDVCVAVQPAALDNPRVNFGAMVDMLDDAIGALRQVQVGKSALAIESCRAAGLTVAGVEYWGFVITVSVKG